MLVVKKGLGVRWRRGEGNRGWASEDEAGPPNQAVTTESTGEAERWRTGGKGDRGLLRVLPQPFLLELPSFFWIFSCPFFSHILSSRFFSSPAGEEFYLPSQIKGRSAQHVTLSSQDVKENNQSFK